MEIFHATAVSIVAVLLLIVVVRSPMSKRSVWLFTGSNLLCLSQIFPLAVIFVGEARLSSLLEGKFKDPFVDGTIYTNVSGIELSQAYFLVQVAFGALEQIGTLLIAAGLFALIRQQIKNQQRALQT